MHPPTHTHALVQVVLSAVAHMCIALVQHRVSLLLQLRQLLTSTRQRYLPPPSLPPPLHWLLRRMGWPCPGVGGPGSSAVAAGVGRSRPVSSSLSGTEDSVGGGLAVMHDSLSAMSRAGGDDFAGSTVRQEGSLVRWTHGAGLRHRGGGAGGGEAERGSWGWGREVGEGYEEGEGVWDKQQAHVRARHFQRPSHNPLLCPELYPGSGVVKPGRRPRRRSN